MIVVQFALHIKPKQCSPAHYLWSAAVSASGILSAAIRT